MAQLVAVELEIFKGHFKDKEVGKLDG